MNTKYKTNATASVYTKSNCSQCDSTKKLLNKLEIPFNEINIEEDPSVLEFLKSEGFRSAPVVITDSDSWAGFNENKIRALATTDTVNDDWDF